MMDCPGCESELRRRRLKNGVVIDSCPDCKGTWLDRGELSRFTRKKRHAQESADELTWDSTYSDRNCCRCGEQMFSGEFAESDIEVDYCRSCEGLWFDARELKKTIQYLESHESPPVEEKHDSAKRRNTKPLGFRDGLAHRVAMILSKTYRAVSNAGTAEFPNQVEGYRMFRGRVVLNEKSPTSPVSKTRCACYREIREETYFVDMSYTTYSEHGSGRRVERPDKRVRELASDRWRYSSCVVECEFSRFEVPLDQALLHVPSVENKRVERSDSDRYATTDTFEHVYLQDGEDVYVYGLVAGGARLVSGGNGQPLIVTDLRRKRFLEKERQRVVSRAFKGALIFCLVVPPLTAALWYFLSR